MTKRHGEEQQQQVHPMAAATAEIVARGSNGVVARTDADLLAQMEQSAGQGLEETRRESFATPFLFVLQDLSPQTKPKKSEYVEGAVAGKIFNTVSSKLYDSIDVILCHYNEVVIEWIPRDAGGGFVATHLPGSQLFEQATARGGQRTLDNGHELQHTAQHFVLLVDPESGSAEGALIAMKSTQLKYSRLWMAQLRAAIIQKPDGTVFNAPSFAWQYKLATKDETNDQGSWYSWSIGERARVTSAALFQQAKAFHDAMRAPTAASKVNYENLRAAEGGAAPDAPPQDLGGPTKFDNEIDA